MILRKNRGLWTVYITGQVKKTFSSPPALFFCGCLPFLLFVIGKVGLNKNSLLSTPITLVRAISWWRQDSKSSLGEGYNNPSNSWLTVGQLSADCWPTVGRQSADSFLGELFFIFSQTVAEANGLSLFCHGFVAKQWQTPTKLTKKSSLA